MKRTKVFYNVLILLAALLLTACQDQKDIPEVSSPEKNLVLSDHISNQKVKSICEDRYGQIWIGTFRGLNKYDGNQYHQYYCVDDSLGLPDNHITDIYRDSHNRLWVATVNGVCLYQANGNFKRVSINGTNKNIEKILEDKEGRIFFLTMTDLYQYDENTNTAIIKLSKMVEKNCYNYSCHIDRKDVMWIVTSYSVKGYRTQDLKLIVQSPVHSIPSPLFSSMGISSTSLATMECSSLIRILGNGGSSCSIARLANPQRHGQLHPSVWRKRQPSA